MIAPRRRRRWFRDPAVWLIAVIVLILLTVGFVWRRFEYRECRAVGHSTFYCLTHDGGSNQ